MRIKPVGNTHQAMVPHVDTWVKRITIDTHRYHAFSLTLVHVVRVHYADVDKTVAHTVVVSYGINLRKSSGQLMTILMQDFKDGEFRYTELKRDLRFI